MIKSLLMRGLAAWDRMKVIPYWTSQECYGRGWRAGYKAAMRDVENAGKS